VTLIGNCGTILLQNGDHICIQISICIFCAKVARKLGNDSVLERVEFIYVGPRRVHLMCEKANPFQITTFNMPDNGHMLRKTVLVWLGWIHNIVVLVDISLVVGGSSEELVIVIYVSFNRRDDGLASIDCGSYTPIPL
jgi:hypothetical protein